jgi:hypothetical protein
MKLPYLDNSNSMVTNLVDGFTERKNMEVSVLSGHLGIEIRVFQHQEWPAHDGKLWRKLYTWDQVAEVRRDVNDWIRTEAQHLLAECVNGLPAETVDITGEKLWQPRSCSRPLGQS